MNSNNNSQQQQQQDMQNQSKQDVDKAPGEERGKGEQVTTDDLKGKKVDADPSSETDKPVDTQKK